MLARVSVCIPVYNGMPYIVPAIQSVLAQTLGELELIVIDNQSTDGTVEAVKRFDDPRLRVLVNERNLGAEGNWNRALEVAQTPYFKLLCADDLLDPECLAAQSRVLDDPQNARVGLVSCRRRVIDPKGRALLDRGPKWKSCRVDGPTAIRRTARAGTNLYGEPGAVMLRAEAVRETGKFTAANPYVIDLEYWCRVLMRWDIYVMQETLASFRVSPRQWSVNVAGTQGSDIHALVRKLRATDGPVTPADAALGISRGYLNGFLRQLAYRWWLGKG